MRDFSKRTVDVLFSGALIIALSPLLLLTLLLIRLTSKGSVFFTQTRAGKHGNPFSVYKFRTMYVNQIDPATMGKVTQTNNLITPIGKYLRRFKIDELPQLLNVLKGDMSVIGPRPTLLAQAEAYDSFEVRRLGVRPGLTGWAQVNGNIELSWDDRIALDVWYVDHRSFWLDLKILLMTFDVILRGERANLEAVNAVNFYRRS